jgi:membrane fusion protein (multidrug efflux system)
VEPAADDPPNPPVRTAWRLPRCAGLPLLALALAGLLSACGKDAPKPGATAPEVTVLTLRSQPLALQQELPGAALPRRNRTCVRRWMACW